MMLFRASNKLLPPLMVTVPPGRAVTVACHTLDIGLDRDFGTGL